MISFVLPTRDRPDRLLATLDALGGLRMEAGADVIVVDNASERAYDLPRTLPNGLRVRTIHLSQNLGAAARNVGVEAAGTPWVVMLDDDSHPVEAAESFHSTVARLHSWPSDVAAVTADIRLPARGVRESGGLPEVFVGCGVAIRREAFLRAGGYDRSFGYYAEEYDLAARLLLRGWRVEFDPSFVVAHHKVETGRDMNIILGRLVRNNGWVMQRYAPEHVRSAMIGEQRERYRAIAEREHALAGYERGVAELEAGLAAQPRMPMPACAWDRFTGLAHAGEAIEAAWAERPFASAALVERGKNAWAVEEALVAFAERRGVRLVRSDAAETLIVGTLSPGPMLDAGERLAERGRRVILPWLAARDAARATPRARAVA